MLVGLIADTHGLIRPEALTALAGVDLILHAGDVGGPAVLSALAAVAPVRAVAGNVDLPDSGLPSAIDCTLDGVQVHMSHGHELGSPTPELLVTRYPADVIVYGHTHRRLLEEFGTIIVVNPGAAGPRRFNVLPSLALLTLPARRIEFVRL
jgi:putative phosphoesterase